MSGEGEGAGGAEDHCGFAEGDDEDDDVFAPHTFAILEYYRINSLVKFPKS